MSVIWIHLVAAMLALCVGSTNLMLAKGTILHKSLGWIWIVCILVVVVTSFFIRELNHGHFSWIHGLSVWTLCSICVALFAIRSGYIRWHKIFMIGTFVGALVAGIFAMMPGRFITTTLGY